MNVKLAPSNLTIGSIMPDDASRVSHRATHASETPIGAVMKDGTVYAGISPDTGCAMYTTPADAPPMTFKSATAYVSTLTTHGQCDWRLPSKGELTVLFRNREAVGGFEIHSHPICYWSSVAYKRWAWGQRFTDGFQCSIGKLFRLSVRCVRGRVVRTRSKPPANRNRAVKDLTILELRFGGLSLSRIAAELNVPRSLVVTRLKRLRDPEYVRKRDAAYYATNKQWIKQKRVLK